MNTLNVDLNELVNKKMIQVYVSQLPTIVSTYFFSVCLMLIAVWGNAPHAYILLWLSGNFLMTLASLIASKLHKKSASKLTHRQWLFIFSGLAILTGIFWGMSATLFIHSSQLISLTLITILILGVLSSALYGMALLPPTYICFLTPTITLYLFTIQADEKLHVLVIASLGLALMLAWLSYQIYRSNYETFWAQFQNERLSKLLQKEKEQISQISDTKTQFLAAASHDLRQPLQAQRLFVEAIHKKTNDPSLKDLSSLALQSQAAMQTILDALLDLSRLDAGTVKPQLVVISLKDLFRSLEQEFSAAAREKGLTLAIHWPSDAALILSDTGLLESILRNLLSNAIRYTKRGTIMLAARARGEYWRIEVRDSGIGIAEEKHQQIFEEFQQIDNPERDQAKGLGLGLSIVQRLCNLLLYKIELKSTENRGSTFAIRIPMLNDPTLAVSHTVNHEEVLNLPALHGLHILVIDDDQAIRVGLQHALPLYGVTIDCVSTIQEAADIAKNKNVDLVITDYQLANAETGTQLLQHLEQLKNQDIPAIVLTGNTAPEQLASLQKDGYSVLHKPVNVQSLLYRVQQVLKVS